MVRYRVLEKPGAPGRERTGLVNQEAWLKGTKTALLIRSLDTLHKSTLL